MSTEKKRYWFVLIIIATFILAAVGQGIGNGTKSQYVKPICDTFGWARTQYTVMYSFADGAMFFGNVFFVLALKKLGGIRNVFLVGVLCLLSAYAIFYNMTSLWMLYIGGLLFGIQQSYINTAAYSTVINSWFVKRKGLALGIIFAGTGIGSMIYNLVVGYMIQNYGWKSSYGLAMIVIVVLAVIAFVIFRSKPSDVGLKPYGEGEEKAAGSSAAAAAPEAYGLTLKEAMKQPFYWISGIGIALLVMTIMGTFINAPAFIGGNKVNPMTIGKIISLVWAANVVGKLVLGYITDKVGVKKMLVFTVSCFVISAVILTRFTAGGSMTILYAYAVFFGLGLVTISVPVPIAVHGLYGTKDFPAIMGTVMAFFSVGGVFSGPSGSLFLDIVGSYVPAFYLYLVLAIVGLILLFIAMNMSKKVLGEHAGGW